MKVKELIEYMKTLDQEKDLAIHHVINRYKFLASMECNILSIRKNSHKDNASHRLFTVEQELNAYPEYYKQISQNQKNKMIASDTIWTLSVNPCMSTQFYELHSATLDDLIDRAMVNYEEWKSTIDGMD